LFGAEISGLSASEVADIFADVPSCQIPGAKLQDEGMAVPDLLVECRIVPSKAEARRAIEAGGIYLNNRRIADASTRVRAVDLIDGRFLVLRRGRKNYFLAQIDSNL
jgi:tyrosyl-tRNA synthetase